MANKLNSSDPTREELRIVMVGKTGVGKSKTGNTILGQRCFESKFCATSVTAECCKGVANVDGQKVTVIDTPGLFDTKADNETTSRDVAQCITFSSPGPHVFLVVIMLGRFTEEETQTVQTIQKMFGSAADKYSMVLFTYGDLLRNTTIEEFLNDSPDLHELVQRCNGQYHVFNNEAEDPSQVTELFKKIRNIVQKNGGSHYTNEMFKEAERLIEEEKQRILMEKEEEIRREEEELRQRLQVEYEEKLSRLIQQNQRQFLGEEESGRDTSDFKMEEEDTQREMMREESKKKETEWKRREDEMERQIKELNKEKKEKEAEWSRRTEEVEKEKEGKERGWREMEEKIKREREDIKKEKMMMERQVKTTLEMKKRMKPEQNPESYSVDRRKEDQRKREREKSTTEETGGQSKREMGVNQQMSEEWVTAVIEQKLREEFSRRLHEEREKLIREYELKARKDAEKKNSVLGTIKGLGGKVVSLFKFGK